MSNDTLYPGWSTGGITHRHADGIDPALCVLCPTPAPDGPRADAPVKVLVDRTVTPCLTRADHVELLARVDRCLRAEARWAAANTPGADPADVQEKRAAADGAYAVLVQWVEDRTGR